VDLDFEALTDQKSQPPGIKLRMLLFLFQGELQDLTFEFARTLSAPLSGQQGAESLFPKGLLNPVKALSTQTELLARIGNRLAVNRMRAATSRT
jgi:hypothetical protein